MAAEAPVPPKEFNESDKVYFDSYTRINIHEEMLRDSTRTEAYRYAIVNNRQDFEGKVVLDMGCGCGILSFFCVQAGAAKVYAVDASDIADHARKIVAANNLSDKIIVMKGKIEDLELPEKVDVIVSEWMGYFLVYECMADSVILAREKFLKPGGLMYPSKATMYFALFWDEQSQRDRVEFWKDVYGIDMSAMMPYAKKCAFTDPVVDYIYPEWQMSPGVGVRTFDMATISAEDMRNTSATFELAAYNNAEPYPIHGLIAWFDVEFDRPVPGRLSTAPDNGYTHWKQSLFYFMEPAMMYTDQKVGVQLNVRPYEKNPRHVSVDMVIETQGHETIRRRWDMR